MTWIHQQKTLAQLPLERPAPKPHFSPTRHQQGRLAGKMESLGFALREEASLNMLTNDVVKSSAIEGEKLDLEVSGQTTPFYPLLASDSKL